MSQRSIPSPEKQATTGAVSAAATSPRQSIGATAATLTRPYSSKRSTRRAPSAVRTSSAVSYERATVSTIGSPNESSRRAGRRKTVLALAGSTSTSRCSKTSDSPPFDHRSNTTSVPAGERPTTHRSSHGMRTSSSGASERKRPGGRLWVAPRSSTKSPGAAAPALIAATR
jgi:hypothetical protein